MMSDVITALQNQLYNFPDLSYAQNTGFVADDSFDLIEKDKFPFYNIVPGNERIEEVDGMSDDEMERWVYPVSVQFATSSMNTNVAIMGDESKDIVGILDFSRNIWQGIRFDKTLGGVVQGIMPGSTIRRDYIKDKKLGLFIGQGEILIEFFEDIGLL